MRIRTGALYLGSFAGTDASDLALPVFAPPTMGVPHPSAFVAEGWEATIAMGPQALASIYSLVIQSRSSYRIVPGIYPKKCVSRQIYENKGTVFEIPS